MKDLRGLKQGERYLRLDIDEPHEKRTTGKHRIISFKNKDWIKEIQDEINSLRMKSIDVDEVFLVLVKIMKKFKLGVGLTDMNSN